MEWLPSLHLGLMWAGKGEKIPTVRFFKKFPCHWKFSVTVSWPCQISSPHALKCGNRRVSQWNVSMFQIVLFYNDRSLILFFAKDWFWMVFTKRRGRRDQPEEEAGMENWKWTCSNMGKLQVTENSILTARRSCPQLSTDDNCAV